MDPLRWRLILNGKAAGNDEVRTAVQGVRRRGIQLEVRLTWETGDAQRYADEAVADGVDTVIAGGGDGTLSEVASALAHRHESADALPALGLLPLGTANDFAMAAGVPLPPQQALSLLASQPARPIDLLRIQADRELRWCINVASGGFGTQVTVETDEGLKRALGGLAYLITGMSRLGRIDPIHARFQGPGFDWEGEFIALGLGNGRQAGGGQVLCPDAWVDDGQLDLTIASVPAGEFGATLGALFNNGKEAALEQIAQRARLPWLEIESVQALTLNLDGEPESSHRFRIDCVPARLRMHLPSGCPLLQSSIAQARVG